MSIVPGPFAVPLHGCGMREPDLELPAVGGNAVLARSVPTPGSRRQTVSYLGKILVVTADTGAGIWNLKEEPS